jgi:hypothetical protein
MLAIAIFLAGCADSHSLNVSNAEIVNKIPSTSSAYVALSEDGSYGSKNYVGSGRLLSNVIRSGLVTHINDVTVAENPESLKSSITTAQGNGSDILFYPTILHWEDRATEWSGKADKVKVKIVTWDVKQNTEVSSAIIDGASGLATFGGDHPQDLLPEPITAYINTLFIEAAQK